MLPTGVFSASRRGATFVWQPIFFCALFFCVACGAMYFLLDFTAARSNKDAEMTSRHLAGTALGVLVDELEGRVVDYALWDVTADQVENGIDPEWATENVGAHLTETFGYSGTFLTSPEGQVLHGHQSSEDYPSDPGALFGDELTAFLELVQNTSMAETEPVSRFVRLGETVFLVTAGAVTREGLTEEQVVRAPRAVLFLFIDFNEELLAGLSRDYRLSKLHLDGATGQGMPLPGIGGRPVANLFWEQHRPGDELLHLALPILLAVALVLFVVSSLIFTLWIRAALAASTAKSQILAKMSHEFRTPLNPIIGFSEIMMLQAVGPVPDRYREYAGDINRSGKHLQNLVEELLDLSKIEAGRLVLDDAVIDVPEVIEAVARITANARPGMQENEVVITSRLSPDLPRLKADELRLRQILINLLSNAVKFSAGQPIEIRADTAQGAVRITVEDQGVGIAEADLERVLMPFEQAESGLRDQGQKGTGLGLAISRELMRLHGGTLDLQSTIGRGTSVILTFPPTRSIAA